jgi:hypothetical protein
VNMTSFRFNSEGDEVRKEKFGLSKIRRMFVGGSMHSDQHTSHTYSDQFNRPGPHPHTSHGNKQCVRKSYSYNHMDTGQDKRFTRHKPFLAFSSSIPPREDARPILYKVCGIWTVLISNIGGYS